jgi:phage protein D
MAIVPSQFKINAADMELGTVFFKDFTVAQALQLLKDEQGIYSYFVGDTLVSGKIYQDNPETEKVKFVFGKNIIQNDLKYRRKDDMRLKVTMTSFLAKGKKLKVTVGDADGQDQKLVCTNVSTEVELKKRAQKELDRLKIDGLSGTLTSFGIPLVKHGYTAEIVNYENPDLNGFYYIDAVTTSVNNSGAYRRVSKLGPRAANG